MFSKGQRDICYSNIRRGLFTLKVPSLSRSLLFKVFSHDSAQRHSWTWHDTSLFISYCGGLKHLFIYLFFFIDNVLILSVNDVALLWSEFHVITGGCPGPSADVAMVNANRLLFVTQTAWKMTSSYPLFVTDLKAWTSYRSRQSSPKKSCRCSTGASKM